MHTDAKRIAMRSGIHHGCHAGAAAPAKRFTSARASSRLPPYGPVERSNSLRRTISRRTARIVLRPAWRAK